MPPTITPRRIGFIVFPDVTALDFVGPMEAFSAAAAYAASSPRYELVTLAVGRKRVRTESSLEVCASHTLANAPSLDTIVVPGGRGLRAPGVLERVSQWLRERAPHTRRLASVCTGIYGLAASGLMAGRSATTHWAFARDVGERFPLLKLDSNPIFVKDGKFYTSAGVTAGIDLTLALIEEDLGPDVALKVARELVVHLKRPGDQAQYSEPLQFQTRTTDRFADLAAWVSRNLHKPLSTEVLAARVDLGVRHFSRRFKSAFDMTPAEFVAQQRLKEACARLTRSRAHIESISTSLGFNSADAFRRVFQRHMGVAPGLYRERFLTHRSKS